MGSSTSTTLVVVGPDASTAISGLAGMVNVRARSLAGIPDEEVDRWTAGSSTPYLVHDRDPLGHVASSWVEFYDDRTSLGALQTEIDRMVAALRSGAATLPDYYVVLEPEALDGTWMHWWLGVLPAASPTRVIPWREDSLARLLRHLPAGRPWPDATTWLASVATAVPDRVGRVDGV